ncbi:MAG: tetratricopeptide repeat protein [Myxococcales bacterium]|nr:tetratricopeptide repeat protein [Myxococcales bacterium]
MHQRSNGYLCLLVGLTLLCGGSGCATAPEVYGTHARYSPAYQGYVMAKDGTSDDPEEGEAVLLLRDPVTGDKLQCREDVLEWRELHEDLAVDRTHDENVALGVGIATGVVFAPLLAVQPVGALALAESVQTAGMLYEDLSSDDPTELLAAGIALYKRKRFAQASVVLERALGKGPWLGMTDKAYLYLGLSYREQKKFDRARLALELFIDRSAVRDVTAYREAEKNLSELGVASVPCESTEPVELYW